MHDIGYAPGRRGHRAFTRSTARAGFAAQGHERLACLVAYHSGARFEAEARGLVDALEEFPEERSAVADLLTYCDLTTDPDGREVTLSARLAGIDSRYGDDSDVARGHARRRRLARRARASSRGPDRSRSASRCSRVSARDVSRRPRRLEKSLQAVETSRAVAAALVTFSELRPRRSLAMRIPIDTSGMTFMAAAPARPVTDFDTRQHKADENGELLYNLQVVALDPDGAQIITVKVAG